MSQGTPGLTRLVALCAVLVALGPLSCTSSAADGDLLAARSPVDGRGVYRPQLLTDGLVDVEGGVWNATANSVFESYRARVSWELDAPTPIHGLVLQAGADDVYLVEGSLDGFTWVLLWRFAPVAGAEGMATRSASLDGPEARFVRLRADGGDGRYAVGELRVLDRSPSDVAPPMVRRSHAPPTREEQLTRYATWKLVFGAAALIAWAMVVLLRRRTENPSKGMDRLRKAALVILALIGGIAWLDRDRLRDGWPVHYHDAFHYYMGAKYAPEIGQAGLYDCAALAESESPYWPLDPASSVRNLQDNTLSSWSDAVARGDALRSNFTSERWAEFSADVRFFQSQHTPASWHLVLNDHGYNATPFWSAVFGRGLFAFAPASEGALTFVSLLDPLLYTAGFAVFTLCFGLEAGALALLLFGFGFPWTCLWTLGGIGRSAWLVCCLLSLGALGRGMSRTAGVAIGLAAALQAFPVLLLLGPAVAGAGELIRRRRWPQASGRLLAAAVVTLAATVAATTVAVGPGIWMDFAQNTGKHAGSLGANSMGLEVLSGGIAQGWLTAVRLIGLIALGAVVLRTKRDWERVALCSIAFAWVFQLASYYYVFVVLLAPSLARRSWLAVAFLLAAVATNIPILVEPSHLYAPHYHVYTWVFLVLFVVVLGVSYGRRTRPEGGRQGLSRDRG